MFNKKYYIHIKVISIKLNRKNNKNIKDDGESLSICHISRSFFSASRGKFLKWQ